MVQGEYTPTRVAAQVGVETRRLEMRTLAERIRELESTWYCRMVGCWTNVKRGGQLCDQHRAAHDGCDGVADHCPCWERGQEAEREAQR